MKGKKIHISVGIAAYNAEANIARTLNALCEQVNPNYVLDAIIVHSDCSTDGTITQAQRVVSDVIRIIDAPERRGFAGAVQYLLTQSSSELTLLLNDDILIDDIHFLEKVVRAYTQNQAGLLCANPQPLKSTNFISRAVSSSFYAYYSMAISFKNGNNLHTYDGKVMCVSKLFKDTLTFPDDLRLMGNVDSYIYFSCIQNGFKYHFVKDAVVHYLSPTTMKDFLGWFIRNNANDPIMRNQFGALVDRESRKPVIVFLYFLFLQFLKNPLGAVFLFFAGFYIRAKAKLYAKNFEQKWDVVTSTKRLSNI